jgi:hypothetical protein
MFTRTPEQYHSNHQIFASIMGKHNPDATFVMIGVPDN